MFINCFTPSRQDVIGETCSLCILLRDSLFINDLDEFNRKKANGGSKTATRFDGRTLPTTERYCDAPAAMSSRTCFLRSIVLHASDCGRSR